MNAAEEKVGVDRREVEEVGENMEAADEEEDDSENAEEGGGTEESGIEGKSEGGEFEFGQPDAALDIGEASDADDKAAKAALFMRVEVFRVKVGCVIFEVWLGLLWRWFTGPGNHGRSLFKPEEVELGYDSRGPGC